MFYIDISIIKEACCKKSFNSLKEGIADSIGSIYIFSGESGSEVGFKDIFFFTIMFGAYQKSESPFLFLRGKLIKIRNDNTS